MNITLLQVTTIIFSSLIAISAIAQDGSETVAAAAQKAFDQGEKELAKGNPTGAITLLKTAVRIQPENAKYQHKLAKAFLTAKKYHEMWVQLRKATVLDLSNEEYSQDFLRMWQYHDLEGMFNIGTSQQAVVKALGEPDKRIENETMKRIVYGFMAVDFGKGGLHRVLDLRGYTAEADMQVEMVSVKTDPSKWQAAHHQVSKSNDNLELTLKNEKIQKWSELFSKQRFPMLATTDATVDGMVQSIKNSLKAVDPNAQFTVVSKTPDEMLYHWITNATSDNPAQHEVAKIMKGKKDFYRVAYVKKTDRLKDSELQNWLKVIGEAELVPMKNMAPAATTPASTKKQSADLTATQSWQLGKSLSFAALLRGRHGPDEVVKKTLLDVSKNAHALNVDVPRPEKLTGDVESDTAAAIQFLLDTAGKPIYNTLQENYGDQHSALFELATKSTLLTMLYVPGDSTSQSFSAAIERAATKAQLEESVWLPLVKKVNAKSKQEEVAAEIQRFQKRVAVAIGG